MGVVVLGRLTEVPRTRLAGWAGLAGFLALLSYAAYPPIALHAVFNAAALIAAVTI